MLSLTTNQEHLNRVSRSFAFCIEQLDEPFRSWVGLSYLLCRLLDTVEDSPWENSQTQLFHFEKFRKFIAEEPQAQEIDQWIAGFSAQVTEGERLLVGDAVRLFAEFYKLPQGPQSSIRKSVLAMCDGMVQFHHQRQHGEFKLTNLEEVNSYCYYVAGVVGEMLTRLYQDVRADFKVDAVTLENSVGFGLFLQKVNLLKDQKKDEAEGRFLVPNRGQVLVSLKSDATRSLKYILALPKDDLGYRTFCGWSLFLGLASLATPGGKVSKEALEPLLSRIRGLVGDNTQIERAFAMALP